MKWVFRLGFVLIPFLFFLSQTAYPHELAKKHSRAPANVDAKYDSIQSRVPIAGLHSLKAQPIPANSGYFDLLSENLRRNASPSLPIEGSGIGAQVAILHFAE